MARIIGIKMSPALQLALQKENSSLKKQLMEAKIQITELKRKMDYINEKNKGEYEE